MKICFRFFYVLDNRRLGEKVLHGDSWRIHGDSWRMNRNLTNKDIGCTFVENGCTMNFSFEDKLDELRIEIAKGWSSTASKRTPSQIAEDKLSKSIFKNKTKFMCNPEIF